MARLRAAEFARLAQLYKAGKMFMAQALRLVNGVMDGIDMIDGVQAIHQVHAAIDILDGILDTTTDLGLHAGEVIWPDDVIHAFIHRCRVGRDAADTFTRAIIKSMAGSGHATSDIHQLMIGFRNKLEALEHDLHARASTEVPVQ